MNSNYSFRSPSLAKAEYASKRERLRLRLQELIEADWQNAEARRLIKRLRRHQDDLFTFLDIAGVPFENNHAERAIRPAVLMSIYCAR